MINRKRLMIDLETLGTNENALVFQISAIEFDNKYKVVSKFDKKITLESLLSKGYEIDVKTLNWWLEKNPKLFFNLISNKELVSLEEALNDFANYLNDINSKDPNFEIWANSPNFDCVILKNLFKKNLPKFDLFETKFRDFRDLRTAISLYETITNKEFYKEFKSETKHEGLSDCLNQIEKLSFVLKNI